jgi:hypothetical protein
MDFGVRHDFCLGVCLRAFINARAGCCADDGWENECAWRYVQDRIAEEC